MKFTSWVPLFIGSTYVIFSALFVLGNYQDHGGDFGQYVVLARNLLLGRPWDHLVIGYPAVPPAYAVLLALVTWAGGVNAYYYALLNSILWAICAILSFHYFRNKFKNTGTAYVFLIAVLFSPYILFFQQRGLPNIFYAMSILLALFAVKRLSEGSFHVGLTLCVILPAFIRTEALALFIALFVYFGIKRQYKCLVLPLLGVVILLTSDLMLSMNFDLTSNFQILARVIGNAANTTGEVSGDFDIIHLILSICSLFLSYVFNFTGFVATPTVPLLQTFFEIPLANDIFFRTRPVAIILTCVAALGILIQREYRSADKLFFLTHLTLLSGFVLANGNKRYLLPLVPIFIFYFTFAIEWGFSRLRLPSLVAIILTATLILTPLAFYVPKIMNLPKKRNTLFTPQMSAVADWISQNQKGRDVAYRKPRLMTLLLDLRSREAKQVLRIPDIEEADHLIRSGALLVIQKIRDNRQIELLEHLRSHPQAAVIWEDKGHAVFTTNERKEGGADPKARG